MAQNSEIYISFNRIIMHHSFKRYLTYTKHIEYNNEEEIILSLRSLTYLIEEISNFTEVSQMEALFKVKKRKQ